MTGLALRVPSGTSATRWRDPAAGLGAGVAEMDLTGDVDPTHFERILAGRHPVTGERLVEARGSAGRRHLAVGTISLIDQDGEAHYELRDVAVITGLSIRCT